MIFSLKLFLEMSELELTLNPLSLMPMKKLMKWGSIILLTPILLILLLTVMLYLPPVQNWAVKQVAAYASESTGMDISVKYVKLVFPLKLGVEGVKVLQPIDSLKIVPTWLCVPRKIRSLTSSRWWWMCS